MIRSPGRDVYPILVLTGGDCLLRADLFDLVEYATGLGIPVALAVSHAVADSTDDRSIVASGVKAVSISWTARWLRREECRYPGHFADTVQAIRALVAAGLTVQINTTVMQANVEELADIAALVANLGANIWEVFSRSSWTRYGHRAVSAQEHEDICHFLYDASHHGFIVRTVEAPFFRRVVTRRKAGDLAPDSDLYVACLDD